MISHVGTLIESFFDEGLGNSLYLVAADHGRTAVVIDPQRDVDRYLAIADRRGWRITHALETHLHADFVSGSREVAARSGATVIASREANLAFPHQGVADQQVFEAGGLRFRVLATPGHTPEHICFLLLSKDAPAALFSGGTLLPGSAARTDLIDPKLTDQLTRALYRSLRERILTFPDDLPVLPTHGAGSFCAAGTRDTRSTTIGREREANPLIAAPSEDAFVSQALADLPAYPDYFRRMRPINQRGPTVLGGLPELPPLTAAAVHAALDGGAVILDTRSAEAFDNGHIPGSFGIPLSHAFGSWVGWVVPSDALIVLLTDSTVENIEALRQLIRIGYDRFAGYLAGGLEAWEAAGYPTVTIPRIPVDAVEPDRTLRALDVREKREWLKGHIPGGRSLPLSELRGQLRGLPRERWLVYCEHEFRSTVANSLLERAGFQVAHLIGGFDAWRRAQKDIEASAQGRARIA